MTAQPNQYSDMKSDYEVAIRSAKILFVDLERLQGNDSYLDFHGIVPNNHVSANLITHALNLLETIQYLLESNKETLGG